jgi:ribosomal-protein-alanine N-acetyltransferase
MRPIEFPVEGLADDAVRVRLIADSDLDAIAAACRDPEIARYTTVPSPYERHHAREWQQRSTAGLAAGTDVGAVIADLHTDELLGSVGLHAIDPATGRCAGGYWVAAEARGRGVAARGMRLLCGYAARELGVARIELWIEPENVPSQRVAEAVGFRREGLMRSFMPIQGRRRDMLMYALLADDLRWSTEGEQRDPAALRSWR